MSYLKIINDRYTEKSHHSDEEYGSWEECYSNNVTGIEIVGDKDIYSLCRHDEVKDGDVLYLVVIEYSSGNSFGKSYGEIEFVETFRDIEDARACIKAIHDFNNNVSKTLKYKLDNGEYYETEYCQWKGYFEHIEDVYIKRLTVGETSGKIY